MAGIPTSNILQPGMIKVTGGATQAIISGLQLLTPQYYNKYIEKYNDTYDYCENCFKKALIKNTYNDITKIFPMEIVDMIMKL